MNNLNVTTNHDEIRAWAEKHHAKPEILGDLESAAPPILRLDFPGSADDVLLPDEVSVLDTQWNTFFELFEKQKLAFELDSEIKDPSMAYRFVKRSMAGEYII